MRAILICDRGRIHDGASAELRAELSAWHLSGEFIPYAIRNLGFISISGKINAPHLRWRPAIVAPRALVTLGDWLGQTRPERLAVSTWGRPWRHQLIATRGRAAPDLLAAIA